MEHTDLLKLEVNKQIFIRAKRSEDSLNTYTDIPPYPLLATARKKCKIEEINGS
jgi:hypothetical protein